MTTQTVLTTPRGLDHTEPTDAETSTARVLRRLTGSDAPALLAPGTQMSGRRFVERVRATAGVLDGHGVGPGRVVALLSGPNHPDVVVARYAARLVGATVVHLRSMNPRSDEQEFSVAAQLDVLERTGADVLVTDAEAQPRAQQLAASRPGLLLVTTRATGPRPRAHRNRPEDCAVLDVTSGTTGAPRLVRQSHASRERLVERLAGDLGVTASRLLSVTPVTHTTAPMIDAVLLHGGSVELHRGFDADAVLDAVEAGVTDLYLAVPHLCALLDHPRTSRTDLSGLRRVVYSGTPTAPHRVAAARAVFGDAVVQVYGTTETGGISALTPEDHDEPLLHGTVGRPFGWVEVSVRDPESGEALPPGCAGAIWVRSPTTADGYWADPDDDRIDPDGWVDTGDLGSLEPHGRLRLVGRQAGVIKLAGLKIYPAVIESALREHPDVSEAVVHGIRDTEQRESVHAVVVPRAGADIDEADLGRHVERRLDAVHVPTRIVVWRGVPLTHSGKPDRLLVRELLGG